MSSRLSTRWTKGAKNKEDIEIAVRNSVLIREALTRIIDEMLEETVLNDQDFDSPNWVYRQASIIGKRRALHDIRNLINFD